MCSSYKSYKSESFLCFYLPDIQGLITSSSLGFWILISGINLTYLKFETGVSFQMTPVFSKKKKNWPLNPLAFSLFESF